MTVSKYVDFTDESRCVKTMLASLPIGIGLKHFSIANLADKSIILTGGQNHRKSAKTFMMDVLLG